MADYTHYNSILDPEWVEFSKTSKPPALPKDLTVAKKIFNGQRAKLFKDVLGPVEGLSTKDLSIPTRDGHLLPCRLYIPGNGVSSAEPPPLYIYLHGGGFLFGSVETEDMHCRLLCVNVPCTVLNVDYRHTPEWKFPTQFHDTFDAVDWVFQKDRASELGYDTNRVILGGISAGGTMALAAAVREVESSKNRLTGLNVSIPSTVQPSKFPRHLVKDGYTSYEQNEFAPILPMKSLLHLRSFLDEDPESPYMSTMLQPDSILSQFPRSAFHVCGADPVRDGTLLFEEKIKGLGVQTRMQVYAGWPHAFWNFPQLKTAGEYRRRLIDDAKWLLE